MYTYDLCNDYFQKTITKILNQEYGAVRKLYLNAKTVNFDSVLPPSHHISLVMLTISCEGHRSAMVGPNESSTYVDVSGFIER